MKIIKYFSKTPSSNTQWIYDNIVKHLDDSCNIGVYGEKRINNRLENISKLNSKATVKYYGFITNDIEKTNSDIVFIDGYSLGGVMDNLRTLDAIKKPNGITVYVSQLITRDEFIIVDDDSTIDNDVPKKRYYLRHKNYELFYYTDQTYLNYNYAKDKYSLGTKKAFQDEISTFNLKLLNKIPDDIKQHFDIFECE